MEAVRIRGDADGGIILPEPENGDGDENTLDDETRSGKLSSIQLPSL
jgi:hypothetical protein